MSFKGVGRTLAVLSALALVSTAGAAAADEQRGMDPNQGRNLVEVNLPNKAAAIQLQLNDDQYAVDFNEHYLRKNADGTVTVTVFGTAEELEAFAAAGFDIGATIEGPATWKARLADHTESFQAEQQAEAAALGQISAGLVAPAADPPIIVLRVDTFTNYAGRFLSVEAKDRDGTLADLATLSLSWNTGPGTPINSDPRTLNLNIDPDTTPDTYIEHRILVRVGDASSTAPTMVRLGSSRGPSSVEAPVNVWLGGGLPPMNSANQKDFTTRYMDPTEVYARFDQLAAEFPNLAELIKLPHKTNGYQRRAQALMAGLTSPTFTGNLSATVGPQAVILTSRDWGHEGGNDITAEFVNPGVPNAPLTVTVTGKDLSVSLATDAAGALSSTAAQVVAAINANPAPPRSSSRTRTAATRAPESSRRARRGTCPTSSGPWMPTASSGTPT